MNYQRSETTKAHLVEAAGTLFAEKGIDGVTTREIARKAGTVQNAITYHFGGIRGLIEAVWARVLIVLAPDDLRRFLEAEMGKGARAPEEWRGLVREVIRQLFAMFYQPERPMWISKFLVRCSLTETGRANVAEKVSLPVIPQLSALYTKITGGEDAEMAHIWSMRILAAPVVFTAGLTEISKFRTGPVVNRSFYEKLEAVTCADALFSLGLADLPHH